MDCLKGSTVAAGAAMTGLTLNRAKKTAAAAMAMQEALKKWGNRVSKNGDLGFWWS